MCRKQASPPLIGSCVFAIFLFFSIQIGEQKQEKTAGTVDMTEGRAFFLYPVFIAFLFRAGYSWAEKIFHAATYILYKIKFNTIKIGMLQKMPGRVLKLLQSEKILVGQTFHSVFGLQSTVSNI